MSTAAEDLAEGLAALDTELGESFVVGGAAFTARREQRELVLPNYGGTIMESVLHVRRTSLPSTMPAVGALVTFPGGLSSRLARVEPGQMAGMILLVLASEFS